MCVDSMMYVVRWIEIVHTKKAFPVMYKRIIIAKKFETVTVTMHNIRRRRRRRRRRGGEEEQQPQQLKKNKKKKNTFVERKSLETRVQRRIKTKGLNNLRIIMQC